MWRVGSKSCNKNRKERWSEGSPRPRAQMNTAHGRRYSDCFPDPCYWGVGHGPVLHRHGPVLSSL
ncbi:hypothetical protein HanRHA438_Chr08g0350041 [Helianthus annuus]|nr:hypothetical protein HanRHA438_Chr08g0350041 [Helianthus annuus]